jgi:microcystin-dependent protein
MSASSANGTSDSPAAKVPARSPASIPMYGPTADANQAAAAAGPSGGGLAHNNMAPYLTVSFIIALQGVFPSHP